MDRWDNAYYGTEGMPMHPDRMTWLKQESLFNAAGHVAETVRFFEMPRARRLRTRAHWDEYEECRAKARWTDMSPVVGCPDYSIGCPECLSERQATAVTGEDMWCPRKTNPYTEVNASGAKRAWTTAFVKTASTPMSSDVD